MLVFCRRRSKPTIADLMKNVRLLIADPHRLVCDGLVALIQPLRTIDIVGFVQDGRSAVQQTLHARPDLLLMDIALPLLNGIEATRQILQNAPQTKIILTAANQSGRQVAEALRAGARGFVPKQSTFEELANALQTVVNGRAYISPHASQCIVDGLLNHGSNGQELSRLTPREREILQMVAEGHTTQTVAKILCVSPKTVATHRTNIMQKLGINNLARLVHFAISEGIVSAAHLP